MVNVHVYEATFTVSPHIIFEPRQAAICLYGLFPYANSENPGLTQLTSRTAYSYCGTAMTALAGLGSRCSHRG